MGKNILPLYIVRDGKIPLQNDIIKFEVFILNAFQSEYWQNLQAEVSSQLFSPIIYI